MTFEVIHGDCLEVMAGMEAGSVDAVVTDPPYGLAFMGKHWDHGLPGVHFWEQALRVLKPSHYLLAFGGTRTWHRLACAIEDAGFEIRDTLMWLYGSGFPKGKACLKPAWEPIILARKPGPMRELWIEECRVGVGELVPGGGNGKGHNGGRFGAHETNGTRPIVQPHTNGRWPANLILDEEAGRELDASTGERRVRGAIADNPGGVAGYCGVGGTSTIGYGDSGGPSRFFYCPKASRRERNAGLEGMEAKKRADEGYGSIQQPKLDRQSPRENWQPHKTQNHHPTVKPVDLMRWLVRLVAREGDLVLDPFAGSGTTGVACVNEGRDFIGIERESEYVEIARRRIEAADSQTRFPV